MMLYKYEDVYKDNENIAEDINKRDNIACYTIYPVSPMTKEDIIKYNEYRKRMKRKQIITDVIMFFIFLVLGYLSYIISKG